MEKDLQKAATQYIVFKNVELFNELKEKSKIELALLMAERQMNHAKVFIQSKEKMHQAGIDSFEQTIEMIKDALEIIGTIYK